MITCGMFEHVFAILFSSSNNRVFTTVINLSRILFISHVSAYTSVAQCMSSTMRSRWRPGSSCQHPRPRHHVATAWTVTISRRNWYLGDSIIIKPR